MSKRIEEIEVLGVTKEEDYTKPIKVLKKNKEAKEENTRMGKNKKMKLKKGVIQKTFCIISALFILGCCVFYGTRLIKYYRIYNPKDTSEINKKLSDSILKNSQVVTTGEGLYKVGGNYIYKGENVNNYLEYSNLIWRIIKIGNDGTIELILDDNINVISFDRDKTSYMESDIKDYLNNIFAKNLNTKLLTKTSVCLDKVEDLNNVTCDKNNVDDYVKLIDISTFLNSKVDEKSYISNEETSNIWTSATSSEKVWSINGLNLSESAPDEAYYVKPVITLNNTNKLLKGNGSKEKPYKIDKTNKVAIGDYVQLGNDTYIAYEVEDDIVKLQASDIYKIGLYGYSDVTPVFDLEDESGIAYYLNNEYYNSLSYKDKLVKTKWYTGRYNGNYNTIYKDSTDSYIGMLNVIDLKFNDIYGYYLLTPVSNTKVYIYNEELEASQVNISRNIRPTIAVKKNILKAGKGTKENPFKEGE